MTIRVLDGESYREQVAITAPKRHVGLTLEAPHGATLEAPREVKWLLQIRSVAQVTVRHFRLQTEQPRVSLVLVRDPCPGLLLDSLDLDVGLPERGSNGIEIVAVTLADRDAPAVIQGCTVRRGACGILMQGAVFPGGSLPSNRLVVRNNTILQPGMLGIGAVGLVRDVHLVGNRIASAGQAALQLQHLHAESKRVLIANNTLVDSTWAFRVWDRKQVQAEEVEVCNNLVLGGKQPDMMVLDSGGDDFQIRGPGEPAALLRAWRFHHNWREGEEPQGKGLLIESWLPPGKDDRLIADRRQLLLRATASGDPFLRPAKESPLKDAGAGGDLPRYVGALPPEGVEAWDWERTWKARAGKAAEKGGGTK
jgi:hypothetical protein